MNYIKMVIIVIFFTIFNNSTFADQTVIKAGIGFSNINKDFDGPENTQDAKFKMLFNFGITTESNFDKLFAIDYGLMFVGKGTTVESVFDNKKGTSRIDLNAYYVDIPVLLKINFPIDNFKLYSVVGPYIGFGVFGNKKTEVTYLSERQSLDQTITFGSSENDDLSLLDYGLKIGLGIETDLLQLSFSYCLGFANIIPSDFNENANFNSYLFTVGYIFK